MDSVIETRNKHWADELSKALKKGLRPILVIGAGHVADIADILRAQGINVKTIFRSTD